MIPGAVERRARWVLDAIGATELGFGDDVPYRATAWEAVERGERPRGDDVAEAFFHLARVEERGARRDEHGRFRAAWSCLDPLDPPLERLRRRLGLEPPRWDGARFAVALTHDVDSPWRWTRIGVRGAAARLKRDVFAARPRAVLREATGLALAPVHRARSTVDTQETRDGLSGRSRALIVHAQGGVPESALTAIKPPTLDIA